MKRTNNLHGQILKEPSRSMVKSWAFLQKHKLQQLKGITGIKTKNYAQVKLSILVWEHKGWLIRVDHWQLRKKEVK